MSHFNDTQEKYLRRLFGEPKPEAEFMNAAEMLATVMTGFTDAAVTPL